jgi:hypothetical protein
MTWTPREMMTIRMANIALQVGDPASARRMLQPLLPKALAEHQLQQRAAAAPVFVPQPDGTTIVFTRTRSEASS